MEHNLKGKALKRAYATKDAIRLYADIPLIQDETELVTPEIARKYLDRNQLNRPINWHKVNEYAALMKSGKWKFHAQGIILDDKGNLLTGQKRLWAIIYSGVPIPMRVSRGSPKETAFFIDRGTAQSARDLAARKTQRKHSPTEASIARCLFALDGNVKPTVDEIAQNMTAHSSILSLVIEKTRRTKKIKATMMMIAAICHRLIYDHNNDPDIKILFGKVIELGEKLEMVLTPATAEKCWNRGAAFTLAMQKAYEIIKKEVS